MTNINNDSDYKRRARAVHRELKGLNPAVNLGQAYDIMAIANGHIDWNHMSPKIKVGIVPAQGSEPYEQLAVAEWPRRHKYGIHLVACRDMVSTEKVANRAISALISSPDARNLIKSGHPPWHINYFFPDGAIVADIYPHPDERNPRFEVIDEWCGPADFVRGDNSGSVEPSDEAGNLFRTRIFLDIDSSDMMRRCIEEATKNPVIVIIRADDSSQALIRLAELHCPRQSLLNPNMIRHIDVINSLKPTMKLSESHEGRYSTLFSLIVGRKIDLIAEEIPTL